MAIPIPPDHGQGPFPDVPMGDIMDEIRVLGLDRDDRGANGKKNKNKNKTDDNTNVDIKPPSRTIYEGCVLERLKPLPGQTPSWGRCGRTSLPASQDELISLVKRHRKETRTSSATADFNRLNVDKQRLITRILDEKKLSEKSKTAEWTLVDVQNVKRQNGWAKEVVRLQVVIKRTDKGSDMNGIAATGTHSYPADDIIDLSVPLKKKKSQNNDSNNNNNSGKKDKKNKTNDRECDPLDDPLNLGFGPNDLPPDNRHPPPQQLYQDPWEQHGPNHPPPQAPLPPVWQDPQNPFHPQQQFHRDPHMNFAGGPRDFVDPNPFQPQHHIAAPGQYDEPIAPREYIHPHQGQRARTRSADRERQRERSRTRSRSRRRQSLTRRPSCRRDSRRRSDDVEDIRYKVERMLREDRDSDASNFDERSFWSRSEGRHSRSPDTSLASEDYLSRDRRKPYHRDSDPRPRYRSNRFRDVEIEPAYTYRRDDRDRRHSYREQDRRPALRHAITYDADDYPQGRGAEPRYLPAPPMQRRNTEVFGDKRNEYFDREWRQPIDREQDAFEAGMRAAQRRSYYP